MGNPFYIAITAIRSAVFLFCFHAPFTIFWALFSLAIAWLLPSKWRFAFVVQFWAKVTIFFCRWILGIRYNVIGRENIPEVGIVVSNHQSSWETYFLQTLFSPQTQVIKKQLLSIPFFGWGLRLIEPIAIDRDDRRGAMNQVLEQGKRMLNKGVYVLIFPEGTRKPPTELGKFNKGGALLARESEMPMIPVSQDSGLLWLNKKFLRHPGTVTVTIHPPVYVGDMSPEEAMDQVKKTIQTELQKTLPKG